MTDNSCLFFSVLLIPLPKGRISVTSDRFSRDVFLCNLNKIHGSRLIVSSEWSLWIRSVKGEELRTRTTSTPSVSCSKKCLSVWALAAQVCGQGSPRGRTAILAWVYLLKWDLLDCLTGCGLGSSTLAVSWGKGNSGAVQSMRVHVSTVPVWCWSPGRLLEGCWISVYAGILKNLHLMPVFTAGLMNLPEMEGKQILLLSWLFMWAAS